MLDAYLYAGIRTPIGRYGGKLSLLRPDDLAAAAIKHVVEGSPFAADRIEDVLLGCTNQAGEDSRNVARHAALLAGLPASVPGQTVNRLCASGLAAVVDAARAVTVGEGELFVAGGVESMSRSPYVISKAATAFGRESRMFDSTIGARFSNVRLEKAYGSDTMPQTADNVARELKISREESDRFAAASQAKYEAARQAGFYRDEIMPVEVPGPKGRIATQVVDDEHPRPESDLAALSRLRPLFDGGIVTAGSASGINDGAVALLIGSKGVGAAAGIAPMARLVVASAAGVEPRVMGIGPVLAVRKALGRAKLNLADIDVIEINEAFAPQVLGCLKLLDISSDDDRVNPNGGAISIGHPLGASGARLVLTAARQLAKTGKRYALVTLCIGVGQGMALVLERT
jgi:3-oxoadipyl-CoA thiolase